jgi:hypothetical protein
MSGGRFGAQGVIVSEFGEANEIAWWQRNRIFVNL